MAQQTIDIGAAPNDGTGDPIRDAFDKCNDNFTELYGSLAGLLDFQGATDCSANPNYPAASQGDIYIVSVAGKIGGASGKVVEVGDFYLALADNAGGTEASVGTSWAVLQANIAGGSVISELDDIPDVNAPTPSDGDVLTWDSTPGEWVAAAPTGGSNALDDLTDVDAPTPADGDVLTFDSGSGDWVPAAPSGGGTASGTSFPGSPSTGDKYYRTDRNLEYVYDGTQWVTTQLFVAEVRHADGLLPFSAQVFMRGHNPWGGTYSLYIERVSISTLNGNATPASNYFTYQFSVLDGAGATNIGSLLSSQNDTQSQWFVKTATVGSVVSSTVDGFMCTTTEVGNASNYALGSVIYRLVG